MGVEVESAAVLRDARELLAGSVFPVSYEELEGMRLLDYGLGNPRLEGLQNITLVCTDRVEAKIQVLLPNQSVPQHVHPPYDGCLGKEENIRVLWGRLRVYLPGDDSMSEGVIPDGKEKHYTLRNERLLEPCDTVCMLPGTEHWFQGGSDGCVALSVYTRVDESRNRFADPGVRR